MNALPSILVVEDEGLILMDLVDSLQSGGFTVNESSSGARAIAFVDTAEVLAG